MHTLHTSTNQAKGSGHKFSQLRFGHSALYRIVLDKYKMLQFEKELTNQPPIAR